MKLKINKKKQLPTIIGATIAALLVFSTLSLLFFITIQAFLGNNIVN